MGGQTLTAFGRIGVGPPTYAPDGLPIRTVADELEQALFGPDVDRRRGPAGAGRGDRPARLRDGAADEHRGHEHRRHGRHTTRATGPAAASRSWPARWSTRAALEQLHQSLLVALRSGAAPWFADVLRDHDEVGDLSDRGRRKMPAMMRGADGRHLALTRRQVATDPGAGPRTGLPGRGGGHAVSIEPRNLTAQLHHRAAGNPPSTLPDSAISNCFPGLEFDFRNIWRRVFEGIEIHEANGFVVRAEGALSRLAGPLPGRRRRRAQPPRPARTDRPPRRTRELQGIVWLEWSNFLADVLADSVGELVPVEFFDLDDRRPPRRSSCGSGRSSSAARSPAR